MDGRCRIGGGCNGEIPVDIGVQGLGDPKAAIDLRLVHIHSEALLRTHSSLRRYCPHLNTNQNFQEQQLHAYKKPVALARIQIK